MKSLINVRYNVYVPKAERNQATHLRFTVVTLHSTMVLWQKYGIFTFNFITGVNIYNYIMHVWLSYSMCAFLLHGFRLFFIQIGFLNTI